jgi:naphthalene 1,2-dioxygenase system ferredoxin subunit
MSEGEGWVRVAGRGDLTAGEVIGVEAGGRSIAVYDCDGELFATDNICTHAYACLSDGWLEGSTIECPLHAARFDVRTGARGSEDLSGPSRRRRDPGQDRLSRASTGLRLPGIERSRGTLSAGCRGTAEAGARRAAVLFRLVTRSEAKWTIFKAALIKSARRRAPAAGRRGSRRNTAAAS